MLLPCLAVTLAAAGAVAAGLAVVPEASVYLTRQADEDVLACAASLPGRGLVIVPGSVPARSQVPPAACGIELLSARGQVLVPAADWPVIAVGRGWLAAHLARPVTLSGAGTGGRWRVVITAVRYQARRIPYVYGPDNMRYVISGPAGPGQAGLAAVMTGLAGAGRVAVGYAAAAGVVLALLAGATLAAARAIVRPLRPGGGLTSSTRPASAGLTPSTRPASAGLTGSTGSASAGLIRSDDRAVEAAARRSAQEMSARLAEVSLELRAPVSVVYGFAQYCRHRGTPPPASLDRMMARVENEAARMDALLRKLEPPPPGR